MRRVLITGANSYIGTTFEQWIKDNCPEVIQTETVDMIGEAWKSKDFHGYDAIFHVAGIAHADVGKVTEEQKALYYKVNADLTVECAKKAKAEGVKQFIFMSSIIVYGESAGIGKERIITKDTPLTPANFYGDSKVKAEEGLQTLTDDSFKVVILRPPMIYGKGSKGNYPLLAKFAKKLPFFPNVQNQRSMLYVGNLCKFISLMIQNEEQGIFFPQNREYVQTGEMVKAIAAAHGRKIHLTKLFNPVLALLGKQEETASERQATEPPVDRRSLRTKLSALVNKAFGNMVYEKGMSEYREEYRMYGLEESIRYTESNGN